MGTTLSPRDVRFFKGGPSHDVVQANNGRSLITTRQTSALRVLICAPSGGLDPAQAQFARSLVEMLGGRAEKFPVAQPVKALPELALDYDLVLLGEERPSWWQYLTGETTGRRACRQIETSLLIMRRPSWPLRHILVVCRAETGDALMLPWVERLALAAEAAVTMLVIVPFVPVLYRPSGPYPVGLETLLHPHTISGQRLRGLLGRLAAAGVSARVHLRDGEPDDQLRQEMATGAHDLVVMADGGNGRFRHAVLGDLVSPLLSYLDRPLLLVK